MNEHLYPPGLYNAQFQPVGDSLPYWGPSLLDPAGPRQEWIAVWPHGRDWDCKPILYWLAPVGSFGFMPGLVLAHLVAAVDAGRSVMMWGSDPECMAEAGRLVGGLAGGGHA